MVAFTINISIPLILLLLVYARRPDQDRSEEKA
jgi:hypothetical protein